MKTGPPRPPRPRPHPTPGLFTYLTAPSGAWGGSGPGCVGSSLPVAAGSEASIRSSGGVAGGSAGGSSGRGGTGPSAWAGERAPLLPWGEGGGWLGGAGRLLPPGWGLWRCQGGPAHLQAVQDALDVPQHVLGHQQPHTGLALQRQQGVNVGGGWGTTEPTPARPPSKPPPPPRQREATPPPRGTHLDGALVHVDVDINGRAVDLQDGKTPPIRPISTKTACFLQNPPPTQAPHHHCSPGG